MTSSTVIETSLAACGSAFDPLGRADRWRVEQAWREVYARATHSRTGLWRIPDFEWHVFSYGDAPCKAGARAEELYRQQQPASFLLWPDDNTTPMYRCSGGTLPFFTSPALDVLVFATDLAWTMAFTHEVSLGLGPYFSRREWHGDPGAV